MAEWFTSKRSSTTTSGVKRSGSNAFENDWSSYENRGNGNTAVSPFPSRQQAPQSYQNSNSSTTPSSYSSSRTSSSSSTAMTNNSAVNVQNLSNANPYKNNKNTIQSPYAKKPIKGLINFSPQAPPPSSVSGRDSSAIPARIDPSLYTSSMKNPKPTVTLPDDEESTLNEEQQLVVESVLSGYSTFFTGPAGSGKSHILSSIIKCNEERADKKRIIVTATTGLAACNISGITIHSFSGIGIDETSLDKMVSRVMGNHFAKKRWKECDVLVIDEVSMMSAKFLDNLNFIASRVRSDRRIFGGIQLVLCGDFFQLPPVDLKNSGFAFEAKCWGKVFQCSILLKKIFRQNGDSQLMNILNEARVGDLRDESIAVLKMHGKVKTEVVNVDGEDGDQKIKPTLLECKNYSVDQANFRELAKLQGEPSVFQSKDRAMTKAYEGQLKHCPAPEQLSLKTGAQVILLKNIDPDNGLVNGSRGVIVDFQKHPSPINDLPKEFKRSKLPVVLFENQTRRIIEPTEWSNKVGDSTVSARVQIPLKLAWALSVHKSQGMTIPHLTVNLRGVFEYGQAYVALSRATKLSLLTILGFDARSIRAHPKVKTFYDILEGKPVHQKQENVLKQAPIIVAPSAPPSLTTDQIQRMNVNRRRALEIQRQRQLAQNSSFQQ